ncbi:MAG: gas vesicle protein GvpG [Verrucomicrobiota bacterium]
MFLLDTILLSPIHLTVWAARKIQTAVTEEEAQEAGQITARLSELYMMLETGRISEAEFDAQEKELLDRMEQMQGANSNPKPEPDDATEAG